MEEGIIKTAPDREKAKSILKMVETTLEMIDTIDPKKFTSHVVKEYYSAAATAAAPPYAPLRAPLADNTFFPASLPSRYWEKYKPIEILYSNGCE